VTDSNMAEQALDPLDCKFVVKTYNSLLTVRFNRYSYFTVTVTYFLLEACEIIALIKH
jgi:hypothetical protein